MKEENFTLKTILKRRSTRSFQKREIDKETIEKIMEAGIRAPTSGNLQPYSIILVRDRDKKEFLSRVTRMRFIENAALLLFFILDFARLKRWSELHDAPFVMEKSFRHFLTSFHDVICCAQNMVIAAESLGLGSVYIGKVIELYQELKDVLALPKLTFPVALLCLGYPEGKGGKQTPRLPIGSILHEERYKNPEDEEIISWFEGKYEGKKFELTEKSIWLYLNVIKTALGEKKYEEAKKRLSGTPFLNQSQYLFGLQYQAHVMPKIGYKIMLDLVEAGFECFRDEF